jgi:hypothetical protein
LAKRQFEHQRDLIRDHLEQVPLPDGQITFEASCKTQISNTSPALLYANKDRGPEAQIQQIIARIIGKVWAAERAPKNSFSGGVLLPR